MATLRRELRLVGRPPSGTHSPNHKKRDREESVYCQQVPSNPDWFFFLFWNAHMKRCFTPLTFESLAQFGQKRPDIRKIRLQRHMRQRISVRPILPRQHVSRVKDICSCWCAQCEIRVLNFSVKFTILNKKNSPCDKSPW